MQYQYKRTIYVYWLPEHDQLMGLEFPSVDPDRVFVGSGEIDIALPDAEKLIALAKADKRTRIKNQIAILRAELGTLSDGGDE